MKALNKIIGNVENKNILLLQGPMGFFFNKLYKYFSISNKIFQIGFNKGDEFFSYGVNYYPFTHEQSKWYSYFKKFLEYNSIDIVFLFGDCRYYHRVALECASETGLEIYVFEEGYIRPNYITLEKNGVNGDGAQSP